MTNDAPEYAFTFRVIASDREGYYYDDWHKAKRYEVVGTSEDDARVALRKLIGDPPRGRFWKARQVGTAKDVRLLTRDASADTSSGGAR